MRYTERRVVITGAGVITPNGRNMDEFWHSLLNGISGIKPITSFDTTDYSTKIAGVIPDFDPHLYFDHSEARRMSRFSQFAIVAAREAIKDACLDINDDIKENAGVVMGVSVNGLEVIEKQVRVLHTEGVKRMSPFTVTGALPNAAAAYMAIELGIKGRTATISTGCSSALNAIGHAFELIKYNKMDHVICGGAEAPVTPSIIGAFCASRSLSTRNEEPDKASRPFDRDRDGYVLSEGAAVFVLESLDSALNRNAKIYAEIIGFANTSEALSMYKMDETGEEAARAMAMAIKDADIKYCEVDYINAHGSSSYVSDIRETKAIKRVFNGHAKKLKISSIKSMLGHPLGVSGGFQTAATLLAGAHGYIPPTINYEVADPDCDLDYVPNESIRKNINIAVVNSFGMGGNNSSMVLRLKN
jgi:3-oxoacyl-[acyl-carrier-protein] synthase II